MNISGNARKDFLWNIVGTGCTAFTLTIILFMTIRINGVEEAGSVSLAFSLSLIFFPVGLYGGRFYQVTDVKNEFEDNVYILLRFMTTMFMPMLCGVFVLFGNYGKLTNRLLIFFTLIKMSESISDAFYGIIQKRNEFYIIGISFFYRFIIGVGLFVVINFVTYDISLAVLGMLFANFTCMVFYDFRKARYCVKWLFSRGMIEQLKKLAGKGFYLAIFSFIPILTINIPRFFLINIDDQAYLSIFNMPNTIFYMLVMLIMINPTLVHMSNSIQNNEAGVTKTIKRLILVVCGFTALSLILAYYIGTQILTIVFGIDFAGYRSVLLMSIINGALLGTVNIFVSVLNIMRRFIQEMTIYIICVFILLLFSVLTVGRYGLIAAITALLVYNATTLLLFGFCSLKNLRRRE